MSELFKVSGCVIFQNFLLNFLITLLFAQLSSTIWGSFKVKYLPVIFFFFFDKYPVVKKLFTIKELWVRSNTDRHPCKWGLSANHEIIQDNNILGKRIWKSFSPDLLLLTSRLVDFYQECGRLFLTAMAELENVGWD